MVNKILDATAGSRMMWFDKNCPLATFIDIRPEVEPDYVMDCTSTTFEAVTFDLILFDPPHMNNGNLFGMSRDFGNFTIEQIIELVRRAFIEFNRILKASGLVVFKWNTHDVKLKTILPLAAPYFTPLFGQRTAYHTKHSSCTYWILLCKSEEVKHVPGMD